MSKYYYKEIYCECLNRKLTIEKYLPVKDYLYKIMEFYSNSEVNNSIDQFVNDVLSVFDKIINENAFDKLDNYIDYLFKLHTPWYEFSDSLKLIIFKDKYYIKKRYYYEYFKDITELVNQRYDSDIKEDNRFAKLIGIYHQYHEIIIDRFNGNDALIKYYEKYASLIIANFYLKDLDVTILDKVLERFTNNLPDIYTKYALNGISDLDYYNSSLGFEGENEFAKYFINNEIYPQERIIK